MRARITELEQENEELLGDAAKHEAQLAVLKEELRAVDRAEKRMATSGNAQVRGFACILVFWVVLEKNFLFSRKLCRKGGLSVVHSAVYDCTHAWR